MKSEIIVNKNYTIGEIDKRLYGSFVEHLGRCVYGGIYEPGHETADENGFRKDVLELVKKIDAPIIRYPGGNFVSGYRWEDGIGDRSKRPKRLDSAWRNTETNEVGRDEFQQWAKQANAEILMTVNLGTRGAEDAKNLLEYCNMTTDTYYANLRRENGFEEPFNIKTWCLGNEMDGWSWQIGHKTADEYGRIAAETAKLMKRTVHDIELIASGSSGHEMPTYMDWEWTVLNHTYEHIDYISLHQFYNNIENDTAGFIGKSVQMDKFIKSVAAVCDAVKAKKNTDKVVNLSFDEWNIWNHKHMENDMWAVASARLEDIFTFEDALLIGCMLMTLQNNCDRVKIACMAQLVNVLAPIMTQNGGGVWLQTIFYPFMYGSVYGRGTAMKPVVKCDTYKTDYADVPYIETSVIHNAENKEIVVFAVNRSLDEDMDVNITFEDFGECAPFEHIELYSEDFQACNSAECEKVAPAKLDVKCEKNVIQNVILKKHSWNMIRYKY